MSREITVVTPENVTITYELAGLGSRAVAHVLDAMVQAGALIVLFVASALIMTRLTDIAPHSAILRFISDFAAAIMIIVSFVTFAGYFIYFESVRNGQSPGKRWTGLRVIGEEGAPIDLSAAAVRNLVRIIEFALGSYIISIISILISPKYKRLGDYAAGTIVVKERAPAGAPEAPKSPLYQDAKAAPYVHDVDLLTRDEFEAVKRFVLRRSELAPTVQEDIARQIAQPIMTRLGTTTPGGAFSYAGYLEEVYRRCVGERGML